MSSSKASRVFIVREGVQRPDRFEIFKYDNEKIGDLQYYVNGRAYPGEFPETKLFPGFNQQIADDVNSGKKEMFGANGERLFLKKQEFASTLNQQYVYDYRNEQLYSIRKKGFLPLFGRDQLLVFKGKENEGGSVVTTVDSKGARKEIFINDAKTGNTIATVYRKWTVRSLLGANSFKVTLSAEADEAFVLMLTVCIDEQYFEKNQ